MKRVLLALFLIFLVSSSALAQGYIQHPLDFRQTLTDSIGGGLSVRHFESTVLTSFTCNPSLINGTSFVANPSTSLDAYVGYKITLNDGSKDLVGWIKATSTETLSATEKITGWTNGVYNTFTSSGTDITSAIETGTEGIANTNNMSVTLGQVFKFATNITKTSGQTPFFYIRKADGSAWELVDFFALSLGGASKYLTITKTGSGQFARAANNLASNWSSTFSYKQVTAPAGVTIVSISGGSVFNWLSDAGIDPNATSFTATLSIN